MENNTIPTTLRRLLIIFGTLLIVSLLGSGFNIYMTLAAPQRAVTVPSTVGFEGRLADTSGSPVADGNHNITFSLYSQATGGDPVWTEAQPNVTTHSGLYSVQLGSVDPTNNSLQPSHFDGPRWLGVKVGTEAEMAPRIPISSVPFALNAQEAAHAEEADQADQALGLQGRSVSSDVPTDGQTLIWNASSSQWLPGTISTVVPTQYPRRASGFHMNDKVVTGNAILNQVVPNQFFNFWSFQNPAANGDSFTTSFVLQAGTYTLYVFDCTAYNRGKLDWYVDGVLQISGQDWYSASTTYNVVKSGSIIVVGDGYHVLKGVVNGKNAGSSGYYISLTQWWIAPTSD